MDGNNERLLTPGEVAALFRVDPKTVTRWAASGRITSIRTPGGHRRFRESEVRALLRGDSDCREWQVSLSGDAIEVRRSDETLRAAVRTHEEHSLMLRAATGHQEKESDESAIHQRPTQRSLTTN